MTTMSAAARRREPSLLSRYLGQGADFSHFLWA
jgi:hypothetical protein